MSVKNRFLILILAVLTIVSPLLSCSPKDKSNEKDSETVLVIGGFEVPFELYRFAALTQKTAYESMYGDDVWTEDDADTMKESLKTDVLSYLKNMYAVLSLAKDYNISADDPTIERDFKSKRSSDIASYGDEDSFLEALAAQNMNDSVYRFMTTASLVKDELYYAMINAGNINDDEDFVKDIINGDEFIRIKQILISNENGKSDEENLKTAKSVLSLAQNGENFEDLISEYNEDPYMFGNAHGYYMIKGVWRKDFENAAFALGVGEISDIVKTDSGYSILKRYEKESDYMESSFDTLADAYYDSVFSLAIENRESELEVTTTKLYESNDAYKVK